MSFSNKYKIKESFGAIETNEIFLDSLAHTKEEELGISEKRFEVIIKERIVYMIFGMFFIISTLLFSKVFYLQIFKGNELYAIGENNKAKISLIRPERGIIYDRNLKKLVSNSPAFDLVCDKRNFLAVKSEAENQIRKIADILQINFTDLEDNITKSKESKALILENISHEKLLVLEARIRDLPDCEIGRAHV